MIRVLSGVMVRSLSLCLLALCFYGNAEAQRRFGQHNGHEQNVEQPSPRVAPTRTYSNDANGNGQPRMFQHPAPVQQSSAPHISPPVNDADNSTHQHSFSTPARPITAPRQQPVISADQRADIITPPASPTPPAQSHFSHLTRSHSVPAEVHSQNNLVSSNPVAPASYDRRHTLYDAHNPGWRYVGLPRRNSRWHSVPAGYHTIYYNGYNYRYCNGVFYQPYYNEFLAVAPPFGIYIDILPFGYHRLFVRSHPYYYYYGSYYDYRDSHYYIVSPPVGAVVESLPEGYETITIDGQTYYEADGAQYKPVVQDNGEIWYEVIKSNA